jgi:hypothetical protein
MDNDLEEQPSASAVFPSSHASLPATHFPSHRGDALANALSESRLVERFVYVFICV